MLSLDDPQWQKLQTNYGDGRRAANLLQTAAKDAPIDSWYGDLFQELCHQKTVSEAAYPALPHLVALAEKNEAPRIPLLVLIGACYGNAQPEDVAPIIAEFQEEWHGAAKKAIPLVCQSLSEPGISDNELRYLLSSLAALHGDPGLADFIEGYDYLVECPNCGTIIYPSQ
ncbi:MAG: hypothetical protein PVI99_08010 [Anaerolineales bacterium]